MKALWRNAQLISLFDQCIVSGCNFLILLYLGRHLPASDFGVFSLAVMSTLFLANLHRATLTRPLNILGANENNQELAARLHTLVKAHLLAIPVSAAVLFLLSHYFFPDRYLWLAACLYISLFYLQDSLRRYWYTSGEVSKAVQTDSISYGGQLLILIVVGSFAELDAATALVLMALPFALGFLFDWQRLRSIAGTAAQPFRMMLGQHWQLSRWLVLTVFVVWTGSQLYPFLLAGLGPVAVAAFMASRNLLNIINLLLQSLDNYLPSRLATVLSQDGPEALRRHLGKTLAQVSIPGCALLVAVWGGAEIILQLVYGGIYDGTGSVLRILAIGSFFALIGTVLGAYSLAMQDTRASFLANLGATAVTVTAGLWLVHAHGINGAAMGATLSFATAMLLQGTLVWSRLDALTRRSEAHA